MRVALIDSAGTALARARELRRRGHDVMLIVPQTEPAPSTPEFANQWRAEGFAWLPVSAARLLPAHKNYPTDPGLATARAVADVVQAFDAAWFIQHHWAMPALRTRRFRDTLLPLIVLDETPQTEAIPRSLDEINQAAARQYARKWADRIAIDDLETEWKSRAPRNYGSSTATVCVPYFENPEFLPATLESLERQTSNAFSVVVVDDGSYTPEARNAFDACASRYAGRGWKFLRQANQFPGAARNRAAREADTEYLIFLDADDIAMPRLVERFLRAALLSGDDCLVAPNYSFVDDPEGPCELLYDPPGSLIGSIGNDMHGGSCMIVRREAFRSIGGFTELRGVGYEDYEFHVRCELEGLRWDVLPELVYRYRMPRKTGVHLSTPVYANHARVLRSYEDRLRSTGLKQLPLAFATAFRHLEAQESTITHLRHHAPQKPTHLKLLLLTCYFPYGGMSGWHRRAQETIRYFGSRYELTLVVQMVREQLAPVRKEALRYLSAIRGVEGSDNFGLGGENLPFKVQRSYTDTFQSALRSMPTDQYHAVLIDQIFMAEFRKDVDTVPVLMEHNIESRLVHQDARLLEQYEDRAWAEFPLRSVVSEIDRAHIDSRVKTGKTVVAPNGADPASWLPDLRREDATVFFPAHLSYEPNVDAVQFLLAEIWPRVRKRIPRARLILAGREPAYEVRSAAAGVAGVEICANPKSMDKIAQRASMTAVALRHGSGTRLKILESMAWGLPVVSTTIGAEGIDAVDGEHLLIRDDPETFAEGICQLLSDEQCWRKLRNAGRELVRERYSWDRVFEPFETELIDLISRTSTSTR